MKQCFAESNSGIIPDVFYSRDGVFERHVDSVFQITFGGLVANIQSLFSEKEKILCKTNF